MHAPNLLSHTLTIVNKLESAGAPSPLRGERRYAMSLWAPTFMLHVQDVML